MWQQEGTGELGSHPKTQAIIRHVCVPQSLHNRGDSMFSDLPTASIEALVKSGHYDHVRVRRAVNTLIDFRDNPVAYAADYRLSCPTAKAELYIDDNPGIPDFEKSLVLPAKDTPYFFSPLMRRALLEYPGFLGSKLHEAAKGEGL